MADGGGIKFKCWSCGEWFEDIPAHWAEMPSCVRPGGNLGPQARAEAPGVDEGHAAPGAAPVGPEVSSSLPEASARAASPEPPSKLEGGDEARKAYRREWMKRKRAKAKDNPPIAG